MDGFRQWIAEQFGEAIVAQLVNCAQVQAHPDQVAAWREALCGVVGREHVDRAIACEAALDADIISEPVDVDEYETIDDESA